MLIENPAHPAGYRKEKHIVAIGGGPIRNGHAHALRGHDPPAAEQKEGRCECEPRPGMHPDASEIHG